MAKDISNKEPKTHWWQRLWQRIVLAWFILTNQTTPELEKEVDKMLYEKERKTPGKEDAETTAEKNTIINNPALEKKDKLLKLSNLAIVKDKTLCVALKDGAELQIYPRINSSGHKETSFRIKQETSTYYIGGIIFNKGVARIFGKEKGATYEAIENEIRRHKGFQLIGLSEEQEKEVTKKEEITKKEEKKQNNIKTKSFIELYKKFKEEQATEMIFEDTRNGVLITLTKRCSANKCFETSIIYHFPDGDELTTSLKNDGAYVDFSDEQIEKLLNESYDLKGDKFVLKDAQLEELTKEQFEKKMNEKYENTDLDEVLEESKQSEQKTREFNGNELTEYKKEEKTEEQTKNEPTLE